MGLRSASSAINPPVKKKQRLEEEKNFSSSQVGETSAGSSKQNRQQLRGAYRKREAARVCKSSLIEPRVLCYTNRWPGQSFCLDCFIIFGNNTGDFATANTFENSIQSLTVSIPTPKITNINFNSAVEEVKL